MRRNCYHIKMEYFLKCLFNFKYIFQSKLFGNDKIREFLKLGIIFLEASNKEYLHLHKNPLFDVDN